MLRIENLTVQMGVKHFLGATAKIHWELGILKLHQ
jgi:hypothetical protein